MAKRLAEEGNTGGLGPPRKKMIQDHFQLGPISNLEELEVKTLQFQNQKIGLSDYFILRCQMIYTNLGSNTQCQPLLK